ncbi:MAG: SUMF1/EgtB/PvdO family nonheme iron enzyme [Armatimonadetes bacterium]|nr:SUMF1/EgtB/PvdO family nonheme iron enzyme [Armatimonadota bacterium]
MKKVFAVTAALVLLCLGSLAQAAITIDTVTVGNAGNTGELSGSGGTSRICGGVAYTYNIGKYEVTAKQYTDFLNSKAKCDGDPYGLYNTAMGDPSGSLGCNIQRSGGGTVANPYTYSVANDWANRPVNYVSYWDACRFANWLSNGQGTGPTETGTYTLGGYNGIDGHTIQRNAGWSWAVTSEDEWYKAAYYKGGSTSAGYWDYPMQSDIPGTPSNDITGPDGGNNANFYQDGYAIGSPYYRTEVGEFENSESAYGTFDQGGNVWEWNEAIVFLGAGYFGSQSSPVAYRGLRGDGFSPSIFGNQYSYLHASYRSNDLLNGEFFGGYPLFEGSNMGFRVSAVPEPSSLIALAGGLLSLLGIRRRRA